ncbi:MAG TPA: amino acid adenylation domain-containing protein, partial [Longimicrobium sp.]|nr:amino acid adenylation domain-containing protein [Longimicrobium sp.]
GPGIAVLDLAAGADALAGGDAPDPPAAAGPESIAYVIYTSGSTGTPKGAMIPHRAVVRTVVGTDYVTLGAGDRVAQQANLSFDAAVFEVWGALLNGATLVGIPRDVLLAPAEYARALRELRITTCLHTTQVFNRHVHAVPDVFAPLRQVLFGGEKADPAAVRACLRGGPPGRLVNVYGPTEATVFATTHEVSALAPDAHTVSIGRPIANTRCYVLDERGGLAGTGIPGELWIGGDGLAAGYLGRPGLSAERFAPDPFAGDPAARMYRSGDRARWLEDGTLEFLGRLDEQVKVRGFRIEPGEVETALHEHPAVRECAVIAREDVPGERRLVAYVAGPDAEALRAAELRGFLKERLPDYLVPSAFVVMDAIPVTPNGKLDRRALPAPEAPRPSAEAASAAPRTPVERVLAEAWAEVLRLERVGIHDNFFALGGDSILSIQVIARAGQRGVRVMPKQMFVHQTIAELAAVAGEVPAARAEQGAVTGPAPLTPVQRWFFARELPDAHHFNLALAFELRDADAALLERAAAAVLAHHDALRLRFRRGADGWTAENAGVDGPVPFERVDLAAVPADRQERAITERASALQSSLDLEAGPLIRFALFDLGEARLARLVVVAHHLVVDAVSWGLVAADLETAYRQLARGEPVALPAKTTSFRDWAQRLADHARSDAVRGEAAFWMAQSTPAAPLPRDGGGANTEGAAERVSVTLGVDDTRALLTEVPPVYGTQVNDALLAALARTFRRWTDSPALRIDLEAHGREDLFEDVDLSRTVGWFTAIYPLRLDVGAAEGPGEALKAVKEQLRAVP